MSQTSSSLLSLLLLPFCLYLCFAQLFWTERLSIEPVGSSVLLETLDEVLGLRAKRWQSACRTLSEPPVWGRCLCAAAATAAAHDASVDS